MRIYTRAGDAGESGLIGGVRKSKDELIFQVLGDLDELNATIGLARSLAGEWPLDAYLERVQSLLFDVGAELAAGEAGDESLAHAHFGDIVVDLEHSMDIETQNLPPLRNFILPGGSAMGAYLHLARTVCRRAERATVELHRTHSIRPEVLSFLNRLSDWLFVAARVANNDAGVPDVLWKR